MHKDNCRESADPPRHLGVYIQTPFLRPCSLIHSLWVGQHFLGGGEREGSRTHPREAVGDRTTFEQRLQAFNAFSIVQSNFTYKTSSQR